MSNENKNYAVLIDKGWQGLQGPQQKFVQPQGQNLAQTLGGLESCGISQILSFSG